MEVRVREDGAFAFFFTADERELGINILKGLTSDDDEVMSAIVSSIFLLHHKGRAIPNNVVPFKPKDPH
jgi:hypothetical protein